MYNYLYILKEIIMINPNSHRRLLQDLSRRGFADHYDLVGETVKDKKLGKALDLFAQRRGFFDFLFISENDYLTAAEYLHRVIPTCIACINDPKNQLNSENIQTNLRKLQNRMERKLSREGYQKIEAKMDDIIEGLKGPAFAEPQGGDSL